MDWRQTSEGTFSRDAPHFKFEYDIVDVKKNQCLLKQNQKQLSMSVSNQYVITFAFAINSVINIQFLKWK
jgi:plasmid maintenance system killer protein